MVFGKNSPIKRKLPDSPGNRASPDNISGKRHPTAQMSTLDS